VSIPPSIPGKSADLFVCYCADCNKVFGVDTLNRSWERILCWPENPDHIAYIVKKPAGKFWPSRWWVRLERSLRNWKDAVSLMRSGELAGFFGTLRVALILLSLAGVVYLLPKLPPHTFAAYVTLSLIYGWWAYNVFDVLAVGTYATFVSRFPAHPLRTIALTIFGGRLPDRCSLLFALRRGCQLFQSRPTAKHDRSSIFQLCDNRDRWVWGFSPRRQLLALAANRDNRDFCWSVCVGGIDWGCEWLGKRPAERSPCPTSDSRLD